MPQRVWTWPQRRWKECPELQFLSTTKLSQAQLQALQSQSPMMAAIATWICWISKSHVYLASCQTRTLGKLSKHTSTYHTRHEPNLCSLIMWPSVIYPMSSLSSGCFGFRRTLELGARFRSGDALNFGRLMTKAIGRPVPAGTPMRNSHEFLSWCCFSTVPLPWVLEIKSTEGIWCNLAHWNKQ